MEPNEEGKREINRLKEKHVISDEDMLLYREQCLLRKLHECQDELEQLLDVGREDPHYKMFSTLVERLENHLQNKSNLM